jgi:HipA-like protein
MKQATVYLNQQPVGTLARTAEGYLFQYDDLYRNSPNARSLSLTLPLSQPKHTAKTLFPFFAGLLSEGYNRAVQCRTLRIDENDDFGLLLAIAHTDTVGAVRVVAQTDVES